MLKDAMETARRCQLVAGYDCLGAIDGHWHRTGYGCGVLNEFGELKPGGAVDDILSWNGESVLLVSDQRVRNLNAGARFQRDLFLSWFGAAPLSGGELTWSMRPAAGGPALCSGHRPAATVAPGTIGQVGSVEFEVPAMERPIKAVLEVTLTSQARPVENRWDYWVFPTFKPIVPQGVRVVQAWTPRRSGRSPKASVSCCWATNRFAAGPRVSRWVWPGDPRATSPRSLLGMRSWTTFRTTAGATGSSPPCSTAVRPCSSTRCPKR